MAKMDNDSESISINDEFLLQCVSNYKPLYDKSDKGYKSILQRENCWASVARSLGCTGNIKDLALDAKARFKSLREKYRREVQTIEKLERSGASASARPFWPLMSFFKFMYKCGDEAQRSTTSNIPQETQVSQASEVSSYNLNSPEDENIIIQFEEEDNNAFQLTEQMENTPTPSRSRNLPNNAFQLTEQMENTPTPSTSRNLPYKRKGKSVPETSNLRTELKQIDNVLLDVSTAINNLNNPKVNADRYDLFSQYMASELKNIGEPHASILMEEMQVAIINYKRELRSGN